MKTLVRLFAFVFVLALVVGMVGCQPAATEPAAPEPAETEPAAPEPAETEPAAPELQTVHVLAMEQAGPTVEEMNAIVGEFNEDNPNVEVVIEYVSYDALHDKIITAMASSPPAYDVFLVDDIWYAEFADAGYIWDVTDKITADMQANIFEAAWDIVNVQGKTYGMPWLLDQKYFFYNEEILQQAGIEAPPTTWEEMIEQATVIKEQGLVEYPIVWSWGQYEAAICDWVTLLYGNGGSLVDENGNPTFNDEKGVETLSWMLQTIDDGITNPSSVSYVEEDVRNVFSQGNAAFATNWNYMYDLVNFNEEESQVTGKIKMSLMPAFANSGVKSATQDGSMGFSVAVESPVKEAAWEYVQYITSEDVQNRYSAHLLPIWQTSFEGDQLEVLKSYNPANETTVPMFSEQFPYSYVRPKVTFYPEASKALQLALQEALTKTKTPQEALDDAAAEWESLME